MVVDDLHVVGLCVMPPKDKTPLLVDSNAVEAGPTSAKRLEPIARRGPEVSEFVGCVERIELAKRNSS